MRVEAYSDTCLAGKAPPLRKLDDNKHVRTHKRCTSLRGAVTAYKLQTEISEKKKKKKKSLAIHLVGMLVGTSVIGTAHTRTYRSLYSSYGRCTRLRLACLIVCFLPASSPNGPMQTLVSAKLVESRV